MNKRILLSFIFTLVVVSLSAQPSDVRRPTGDDGLFVQKVPKASVHKSYYTVDPTNVITGGVQYMNINNILTTSKYDYAPTIMFSQIRKVGWYAKLGIGGTMQTGTMGVLIRAGKYFRPYIGAGFLWQKAAINHEYIYEIQNDPDYGWEYLYTLGVSEEKAYELAVTESGDYHKYTFNPTAEIGTTILLGKFAMNLGVGYIYNQDFPFYDKSLVYQIGFGYNWTRDQNKKKFK